MKKFLHALLISAIFLSNLTSAFAASTFNSNVTPTDCSNTITLGGTAQNAIAANQFLNGFVIANLDTSEVMWISFTGTAVAGAIGSYPLAPATVTTFAGLSSYFSSVGFNRAVSVVAATTAHKYSCTRW